MVLPVNNFCNLILEIKASQKFSKRLGQATDVSRVYIFENLLDNKNRILASQKFEWVAKGIKPQISNPDLKNANFNEVGFSRWISENAREKYRSWAY